MDVFGGNHWAWIQEPFLAWRGGFGGLMVVHGHTPPPKHRAMSGYPDPHVVQHDRLCLDGGSAATGIVAGSADRGWAVSPVHGAAGRWCAALSA